MALSSDAGLGTDEVVFISCVGDLFSLHLLEKRMGRSVNGGDFFSG